MSDSSRTQTTTTVVRSTGKSIVLAVILAMFFGPFGLLYASLGAGVIMLAVYALIGVMSFLTLGLVGFFFLPAHLICVAWAALTAAESNRSFVTTRTTVSSD